MKSPKKVVTFAIFCLIVTVNARPKCITYGEKDVVCSAGGSDYVLQRGLVSDNNKTTGITLRSCRIIDVQYEAFQDDDNLRYIDLSINSIQRLKLGVLDGNRQVTYLNMSHNMLTTFPLGLFDQKPNLDVLDLKENKLNLLERGLFDPLQKLVHLDLSNNFLVGKDFDPYLFDKNHGVKFMDFSRNDMNDSPEILLHSFRVLNFLNLDRCSLKEIPTFATRPNLKTMKHLMMSTNQINKLDQTAGLMNLDNLEILNLAENVIEDIAADVFVSLKKLKMVVLRNNRLTTLPDSLFLNLRAMVNIDLSHNLIEYVPVNALRGTSLRYLNLSHNRFSYLEANFCFELRNSGSSMNKFYFNDNPWQCACLNEILKELKTLNVKYNAAKYNGAYAVCVTTKVFTCKRQMSDNSFFIEMYNDKGNKGK